MDTRGSGKLTGKLSNKTRVTGFDNNHKIAVRDHVRVLKFWRIPKYQKGQIPKSIYLAPHLLSSGFTYNFL